MFWPANLGGHTTFVSTHGTSMEPRFHSGDLAIVQPTSDYKVGTIAAYKSSTLGGTIVLHRITAIDHGRFSFKGDNNDFTDPDHPSAADVVGTLRARVPHGGEIRAAVAQPRVWLPLLVLILFGVFFIPQKRSRRRAASSGTPRRAGRSPGVTAAALILCGALLLAGGAWLAPRAQSANASTPYRQSARLGYSAKTRPGAAYADGRVETGDPVFTRMVPAVTVDLRYAFSPPPGATHRVHGTAQVVAEVSSSASWQREIALTPVFPFRGDQLHRTATLRMSALREIQNEFTHETGVDASAASVSLVGKIHVVGSTGGSPLATDLKPEIDFMLTPVELLPKSAASGAGAATVTKTGSVTQAVERPGTFGFGPVHLPGAIARWVSLALLVAALAALGVAIVRNRRRPASDEGARTVARYRHLLVSADSIPALHRNPVVRVDNMRDLSRLAKHHDELVVHAHGPDLHRFALFTDPVVYLLEIGAPTETAPSPLDLAKSALAGLEAHAAKRRHQALRVPIRRHPRVVESDTVPNIVAQDDVLPNKSANGDQGNNVSGVGLNADSTR